MHALLIGDSITEAFNVSELLPEFEIDNRGVSGNSTVETYEMIKEEWFEKQPEKIFICIGTNDLARERTNEEIVGNILKIKDKVRSLSPESKVVLTTIFPTRDNGPRPNERISIINQALYDYSAEDGGVDFFDINFRFKDDSGKLKAEFTEDGLHLLPKAYDLWASELRRYLK